DPARFPQWIGLCEAISLRAAARIVVVSDRLKAELLSAGIAEARIALAPNAVDPDVFRPNCGGATVRQRHGFSAHDVVVGFVGSFSYWHGISVLAEALRMLLDNGAGSLRVLLIGSGPLSEECREKLSAHVREGRVVFAGSIPHTDVPAHLDAADILVSPHIPMPGDTPFFGSPTKLFEYMAMGKAIVASNLEQIGEILEHNQSAYLVEPGSVRQLADAIELLTRDADARVRLGPAARKAAAGRHTWQQTVQQSLRTLLPIPTEVSR